MTDLVNAELYTTCYHCYGSLGANGMVEHYPVGHRLAYDAAKGRLWAVCPECGRWNLSPFEERRAAIAECERLYYGVRVRASTANISLVRLEDGSELVRVRAPLLPEMAGWRYGVALRHRRKKSAIADRVTSGVVIVSGGLWMAHVLDSKILLGVIGLSLGAMMFTGPGKTKIRVLLPDGRTTQMKRLQTTTMRLIERENDAWALRCWTPTGEIVISGERAARTLRGALLARNSDGAREPDITHAVELLEHVGTPAQFLSRLARASHDPHASMNARVSGSYTPAGVVPRRGWSIYGYPTDVGIALEMALDDETERRALEGDDQALLHDWALAEIVASVDAEEFLPEEVLEQLYFRREADLA